MKNVMSTCVRSGSHAAHIRHEPIAAFIFPVRTLRRENKMRRGRRRGGTGRAPGLPTYHQQ